jgi:hypothetical protein
VWLRAGLVHGPAIAALGAIIQSLDLLKPPPMDALRRVAITEADCCRYA